jgi:acyl-lipid omega-6 desaturase (Delta-12 desaturase)
VYFFVYSNDTIEYDIRQKGEITMQYLTRQELSDQIEIQRDTIRAALKEYSHASIAHSVWQLVNSVVPFILLWALGAYVYIHYSFWPLLLITPLAAGFMVRTFIIFHDCCHGSFFEAKAANNWVGRVLGVLVLTPYDYWKHDHSVHHATAGNLDKRGVGDVATWTVDEYQSKPWSARLVYRLMRGPIMLLAVGPFFVFAVVHRFWRAEVGRREKASVFFTDIALFAVIALLIGLVGWRAFLAVQIPILWFGTLGGVWLFYVQHNFEGTYWERQPSWDFYKAGLLGSSFYKLPAVLNWFTGNIGFHHIHHLAPKVPNYNLPKAQVAHPIFQQVRPLTFRRSLKSLGYRFWDEEQKMMVGFSAITAPRAQSSVE